MQAASNRDNLRPMGRTMMSSSAHPTANNVNDRNISHTRRPNYDDDDDGDGII